MNFRQGFRKLGLPHYIHRPTDRPQGQYWAGRTPPPNNGPPNMAAANFVVITSGEVRA